MDYRVENKYILSEAEMLMLENKLKVLMHPDPYSLEKGYTVSSLYFDDMYESGYLDSLNGDDLRVKYRARIYNGDLSQIKLETKRKLNGKVHKEKGFVSIEQMRMLMSGIPIDESGKPYDDFKIAMDINCLRPKVIVTYDRNAYIDIRGNVRITFDRNVRACARTELFLDAQNEYYSMVSADGKYSSVLEVKYDEYLPEYIKVLLEGCDMLRCSFSKYTLAREGLKCQLRM